MTKFLKWLKTLHNLILLKRKKRFEIIQMLMKKLNLKFHNLFTLREMQDALQNDTKVDQMKKYA